jgi:carbonic anhydrase/acetyltransferase-like protein (isoleucine patch superfamily)
MLFSGLWKKADITKMGNISKKEKFLKMIGKYKDKLPKIHKSCFIADNVVIFGDVTIEEDASVWFSSVIRGDSNGILIGRGSNIQDNCTLHANPGQSPVLIGEYVTVGHNVMLHGCKIGNNSLIGIGTVVLDDVEIGEETIIGAGSLVTANKKIPAGVLCMGSPAKVVRELTAEERKQLRHTAEHYIEIAKDYSEMSKEKGE